MARLEAVAKGLFYPTGDRVVDLIASTVPVTHDGPASLLDPCAGDGAAAAQLAHRWGCKSYGVELQKERADQAQQVLDVSFRGSYHQISVEDEAKFGVLFLNPPYDDSQEDDGISLRQEIQFLRETLKHLAHNGLLVYIVPQRILHNQAFLEIAQQALRSIQVWRFPDPEFDAFQQVVLVARLYRPQYSSGWGYYGSRETFKTDLQVLSTSSTYEFEAEIPSTEPVLSLKGKAPETFAPSYGDKSGVYGSARWAIMTENPTQEAAAPLLAPRPGHQAMLLAAGALNGVEMDGFLVKGGSEKHVETIEQETTVIEREQIVSHLSTLNLTTGDLDTWKVNDDPDKTADWFKRHRNVLRDAILTSHTPAFDGRYDESDFTGLRGPGILPGRSKAEILPLQKEAAAAINYRWKSYKTTILSGEQGIGKTTCAVTACELAGHDKVVVICPSHLVPKWIREVEQITGKPGIAVTAKKISDVDAFFAKETFEYSLLSLLGERVTPKYLILSKEMAKLGNRWAPAYHSRQVTVQEEKIRRDMWGTIVSSDVIKSKVRLNFCPQCGQKVNIDVKVKSKCECGSALWTSTPLNAKGTVRWPLARRIQQTYSRQYALVLDEVHQYASADSDQSRAVQMLASGATKILAMTGTLYGGRASSIFHLLYKVEPSFRQTYKYEDCPRFVSHHGLYETLYDEGSRTSVYGYRRGGQKRVREIPGMSPAMIPMILPYTIFFKLKDLEMDLPAYSEEVSVVKHDSRVAQAVRSMEQDLRTVLRKHPEALGQYLMACLGYPDCPEQEEAITVETESGGQEVLGSAPAFPEEVWPKDQRVVEIAVAEKAAGRGTLVFFSQTHRRDARPRVKKALEAAGLRVVVLDSNVAPEKREEWVQQAVKRGFDVMLTNGKLVETGMDLLFAHTIIQYGIEYSINTLRQSIRRSWRLGQTKPIKVIFLAYQDTMQATAMDLIARKMRAAEMVDGDEAGGLAQFDAGGANFLVELAQEILTVHPLFSKAV